MELNLVRLIIEVNSIACSSLTPLVSGKGAAFEAAVHNICCMHKNNFCHSCPSIHFCPVALLISKLMSSNPEVVRRYQKPALPYVFSHIHSRLGETSIVGLTLIGPACFHLSELLASLATLIGGKQCISLISALDYQNSSIAFDLADYEHISNMTILAANELLSQYSQLFTGVSRIRLVLKSPLRLMSAMRELKSFDPVVFCCAVMRRISSLAAYYGDVDEDHDLFRYLAGRSREVSLIKAYATSKTTLGSVRGVMGSYEMVGPFDLLGPYLMLASLLHVGKRASYGLGAFDVAPIS